MPDLRHWRNSICAPFVVLLAPIVGCGTQASSEIETGGATVRAPDGLPPAVPSDSKNDGVGGSIEEPDATADSGPADGGKSDTPSAVSNAPTSGVKLRGRVVFDGMPPTRRVINMAKDAACIKLHGDKPVLDEALIVGDGGGVQNAFVYIRRGAPKIDYPTPKEVIELGQKDCMYRPRVQGMMTGQTLRVLNNDPVTHNVRSFPIRNKPFNFGQPAGSEPRERLFDAPEREIEIQCDIHPWMHAYLFVMDHPYFAVTAADGTYAIQGLPSGEYSVGIWHEVLGKQDRAVNVALVDVNDINFQYRP